MSPNSNLNSAIGMSLMIGSMSLFPFTDGIMKYLTMSNSIIFLLWIRFLFSLLITLPIVIVVNKRRIFSGFEFWWQTLRTFFLISQLGLFLLAISKISLVDALGAFFIAPIITMILAVIILKERIDKRKLIAVFLGFVGTIIVIRPNTSMEIGILYALGAGFMYACFMIITRKVVQNSPPLTTLMLQSLIGTIVVGPFAFFEWNFPSQEELILITLMTFISIISHVLLINAFRFTHASTLSPLSYFEIVSATLISFFYFGDFPTLLTWIGILFIVLGGGSLIEWKKIRNNL